MLLSKVTYKSYLSNSPQKIRQQGAEEMQKINSFFNALGKSLTHGRKIKLKDK